MEAGLQGGHVGGEGEVVQVLSRGEGDVGALAEARIGVEEVLALCDVGQLPRRHDGGEVLLVEGAGGGHAPAAVGVLEAQVELVEAGLQGGHVGGEGLRDIISRG